MNKIGAYCWILVFLFVYLEKWAIDWSFVLKYDLLCLNRTPKPLVCTIPLECTTPPGWTATQKSVTEEIPATLNELEAVVVEQCLAFFFFCPDFHCYSGMRCHNFSCFFIHLWSNQKSHSHSFFKKKCLIIPNYTINMCQ